MNCPEKIAGAYLRLNGFFLLPHFTVFNGDQHSHVDFLALKPPAGKENCQGTVFPTDEKLFEFISRLIRDNSQSKLFGVVVEVKGGTDIESPEESVIEYAQHFIGEKTPICSICFSKRDDDFKINNGLLIISLKHSLDWSLGRFDWMNKNIRRLTKSGSWTWSDDFLSDLLYLQNIKFDQIER